jgi:hypothetical protein
LDTCTLTVDNFHQTTYYTNICFLSPKQRNQSISYSKPILQHPNSSFHFRSLQGLIFQLAKCPVSSQPLILTLRLTFPL